MVALNEMKDQPSTRVRPPTADAYRLAVLSRVVAAMLGGYIVTNMYAIVLSKLLPMPRAEAVGTALLSSFAIYAAIAMWVFAVRSASKAWGGLLIALLCCAVMWGVLAL